MYADSPDHRIFVPCVDGGHPLIQPDSKPEQAPRADVSREEPLALHQNGLNKAGRVLEAEMLAESDRLLDVTTMACGSHGAPSRHL